MENLEERQLIGEVIRKARKEKKITQKSLSSALNIRQDVISDYENGKTKIIPYEKRVKLAEILDIDLAKLLYSVEMPSHLKTRAESNIKNFIKYNPIIVADFFESKFYDNIEKVYNEKYNLSLDSNHENYDAHLLLEALEFYRFMTQHATMFARNTEHNILLVEFLKAYYPAIARKFDSVFIDIDTCNSLIYPFDQSNEKNNS